MQNSVHPKAIFRENHMAFRWIGEKIAVIFEIVACPAPSDSAYRKMTISGSTVNPMIHTR